MTEGTYDKDYVATHVVGFDRFEDYVLGREDGVPKTPEWAAGKTHVPEWTIKALAREWAAQPTTVMHFYGGSYVRGPYAHEPARLEACLLGMQALGKPGAHQYFKMGGDDHWMNDTPRPKKTLPDMRMMEGLIEEGRQAGEASKWTRNVFPGQKQPRSLRGRSFRRPSCLRPSSRCR
jgi:anaerobic selenocysteine-containing dehydrogenase